MKKTCSVAAQISMCCFLSSAPVVAATYRVVAYLTATTQAPIGIVEGDQGVLYSQSSNVEVLSITKKGIVTVLASFPDPPNVVESAPGAAAANGRLYSSISQSGGATTANAFSVAFTPASLKQYPSTNLAPVIYGNLPGEVFGTAFDLNTGKSDLAKVDLQGSVNPFYSFPVGHRQYAPIIGLDGNFYGAVQIQNGGAYFYKATPAGVLTRIANIPTISSWAGGGLVLQGSDGNFYGVQTTGLGCGAGDPHGAVYKLTPAGQYSIVHDFGICGPAVVDTLIEASDGNLYGATETNNEIFRLSKTGDFQVLFKTTDSFTQGLCTCVITQGSDGILYGSAYGGGPGGGYGLIFAFDAGLPIPKPKARVFSPQSGSVGTQVLLWGNNLLNAAVSFNGTPATQFFSTGPNYVLATVPAAATSGPITVTTPGGTYTTTENFTVQ